MKKSLIFGFLALFLSVFTLVLQILVALGASPLGNTPMTLVVLAFFCLIAAVVSGVREVSGAGDQKHDPDVIGAAAKAINDELS